MSELMSDKLPEIYRIYVQIYVLTCHGGDHTKKEKNLKGLQEWIGDDPDRMHKKTNNDNSMESLDTLPSQPRANCYPIESHHRKGRVASWNKSSFRMGFLHHPGVSCKPLEVDVVH